MSGATTPTGIFDIYEVDEDDEDEEALIGHVELDGQGRLAILDAEPARRDFLQTAIDRVNSKPAITRLAPPPPGSARFALGSETVERNSPEFPTALGEHLTKYFGLRLA